MVSFMLGELHLNFKNALDTYKETELFQGLRMNTWTKLYWIKEKVFYYSLRSALKYISQGETHSLKYFSNENFNVVRLY